MDPRSTLMAAAAWLAVVLVSAAPAFAHEEISPKAFPTGRATFLTLTVANEAAADLVTVGLRGPAGVAFGTATRSPAGWAATVTDHTVTWTGGAVKPRTFESWGFEIAGADQPATLTYTVTLGYAGGKADEHEVEVTATAPGASGAGDGPFPSPATPSTAAGTATPSTSPTTAVTAPARSGGSETGSGRATAALVISIVALLLAVGALVVGARRGGGEPTPNRTSGGGAAAGAAQDW